MQILKYLCFSLILFSLVACSSAPPVLTPSKPLVNGKVVKLGVLIPIKYHDFLSRSSLGESKVINGFRVLLGEQFTSALGNSCRVLVVSAEKGQVNLLNTSQISHNKRIACELEEDKQWRLIPAIIEQANEKSIFSE